VSELPDDTRLGAIRLRAGDAGLLRDFYERVIGLRGLATGNGVTALGAGGVPLVELVSAPDAPARPPATTGLFHLALLVPTRVDLSRALRRVFEAGWHLSGASDHLVSEALYLSDPEGNGIEL
jgi:catechol 2,3-dioxygenase